jgi:hypothetical protein
MEITISEFRKNIKKYFDSALNNEVVCIERGGVHYNLTARIPMAAQPENFADVMFNLAEEPEAKAVGEVKLCKHGSFPELCKFAKVINGKKICK